MNSNGIKKRYSLFFIAIVSFILTPIHISVLGISAGIIIAFNYSILVILGMQLTDEKLIRGLNIIFGCSVLLGVWIEFYFHSSSMCKWLRILSSLLFFLTLAFIHVKHIKVSTKVTMETIFTSLSGYILLGVVGGIFYEILHLHLPDSIKIASESTGYLYYYFSFMTLSTVGYGDIIPTSPEAQALSVLISIVGQLYLTVLMAFLIGKFLIQSQADSKD